jgi:hypothetical protein
MGKKRVNRVRYRKRQKEIRRKKEGEKNYWYY